MEGEAALSIGLGERERAGIGAGLCALECILSTVRAGGSGPLHPSVPCVGNPPPFFFKVLIGACAVFMLENGAQLAFFVSLSGVPVLDEPSDPPGPTFP